MTADTSNPDARERILQAAESLFAAKGYAATSIQDIASEAEVNRALLYYYFADKQALYQSVIDECIGDFRALLDRTLGGPGSAAERLAAFVRGHVQLIWASGDRPRLIHRCLVDSFTEQPQLLIRFQGALGRLYTFLNEAVESGEFRPLDPEIVARTILGPAHILSLWRLSEEVPFPPEYLADQVVAQLLDGLRAPSRV